jgi:hypothetical protein
MNDALDEVVIYTVIESRGSLWWTILSAFVTRCSFQKNWCNVDLE